MAEQQNPQSKKDEPEKRNGMTLEQVLKIVKRPVPDLDKDKKPKRDDNGQVVMKEVAIKTEEVMNWAVYDERVSVVTIDGHKFHADRS